MEIWLLRHAMAEDRAPSGRDEDRSLTPEGKKRAEALAKGLARLEPKIAAVITSPYRRARQTAEPAARELGLSARIRESTALEPSVDPERILEELSGEEISSVLLVGHQPHLGALLGLLVSGHPDLEIPLKKGAVARVEVEGRGRGQLRAMLPARVLERLAGG